jgi:hypothetical protein
VGNIWQQDLAFFAKGAGHQGHLGTQRGVFGHRDASGDGLIVWMGMD